MKRSHRLVLPIVGRRVRWPTILLAIMLAGCATKNVVLYEPQSGAVPYRGTVCGGLPFVRALLTPADGVSMSLEIGQATGGGVALAVQMSLAKGTTFRFSNDEVVMQTPDDRRVVAHLSAFTTSVAGRNGMPGRAETLSPVAQLEGKGRDADLATPEMPYLRVDHFLASTRFEVPAPQRLTLTLPPATIDGQATTLAPIEFSRSERRVTYGCVQ